MVKMLNTTIVRAGFMRACRCSATHQQRNKVRNRPAGRENPRWIVWENLRGLNLNSETESPQKGAEDAKRNGCSQGFAG